MTNQPQWDIYESAILLDAYLSVAEGSVTRQAAIETVSKTLRQMAINKGLEVDETYRNSNGITLMLKSMDSAFQGHTIHIPASKLFIEIVSIYRNNNGNYQRILSDARVMAEKTMNETISFKDWLRSNQSTTNWKVIEQDIATIESFFMQRHVLRTPLLETVDVATVNRVRAAVDSDKIFRMTYQNRRKSLQRTIALYYNYVKSISQQKNDKSKAVPSTVIAADAPKTDHTYSIGSILADALKGAATEHGDRSDNNTQVSSATANQTEKPNNTEPSATSIPPVKVIDVSEPTKVNQRAQQENVLIRINDIILDYFSPLMEEYPGFVFTNVNAMNVLFKRATYIYPRNLERRGNVLLEIWHLPTKGSFDLYIKREYLTADEYKESAANWNKTTQDRGMINRSFKYVGEFLDFVRSKLDMATNAVTSEPNIPHVSVTNAGETAASSEQESPKQSSATDQRLQQKYPEEYKLIRKKLYELTQEKKDGITISDFQDALKLQISYFVSLDILSNATWSEKCGNSLYGVPRFRYIGEYSEEIETQDDPALANAPVTSTNSIRESLLKTVEYLATRYDVRLSYDHFETPTTRSNDILYKARNNRKDIMWVYYIHSRTSHYVSVETEPEYLESIDHKLNGFTRIQDRYSHPCRKMFFEDYDAIRASLVEICDAIDSYFGNTPIKPALVSPVDRTDIPASNISFNGLVFYDIEDELRHEFVKWLIKHNQDKDTAVDMMLSVKFISNYAIKHLYSKKSLYQISDPEEISRIWYRLIGSADFAKGVIDNRPSMGKAIDSYHSFLEDRATKSGAEVTAAYREKLYKRLRDVSRVYDDPAGITVKRILSILGPDADAETVRSILDDANWAVKLSDDVYSFSPEIINGSRHKAPDPSQNNDDETRPITDKEFYAFLRDVCKMAPATCGGYTSAIRSAEAFAKSSGIVPYAIYGSDPATAESVMQSLMINKTFIRFNQTQHNRFQAAFGKLKELIRIRLRGGHSSIGGTKPDPSRPTHPAPPETSFDKEKYIAILMQRYRNGMTFDAIDLDNFREEYELVYDVKLSSDDSTLESQLRKCGVVYQGRLFPADGIIDPETREKLFNHINGSFSSGKKVLYYKALFAEMADDFSRCFVLTDENMLRAYLEFVSKTGEYFFSSSYMSKERFVTVDHRAELEELLLSEGKPMLTDNICAALSYIPQDQIVRILSTDNRFLRNAKGEYFHIDIFEASDEELEEIAETINRFIDENEYAIWTDVWNVIRQSMPDFLENNLYLSWLGVRNAVAQRLKDRFNFEGAVISLPKDRLDIYTIYMLFAKHHATFTADEVYDLSKKLDTVIYHDALERFAVRVSRDQYVSKESIHFDVDAVDKAIGSFMSKDYIKIRDVDSFLSFPYVGYEWNEYLLQSFLISYSQRFVLLNNGLALNAVAGVIARKNSSITDFVTACAWILADSHIELKEKEALNYLADSGMIIRRSYRDIGKALSMAAQIRGRRS